MNMDEMAVADRAGFHISSDEPFDIHAEAENASFSIYENHIPEFVCLKLDQLYGSIYSTLDQFRMDGKLATANTYVAREQNEIKTIFIFHIHRGRVTVLNEQIVMERRDIEIFSKRIFARYKSVATISIKAVQTEMRGFSYPYQRFHCAEDIVAPLPGSAEAFLSHLGSNMREQVKRYTNKLKRTFPSFQFQVYVGNEIDDDKAMDIYHLHKLRMRVKHGESNVDIHEFRKIMELAKLRGMISVATIDGKVCGGLICWRVDDRYVMRIIAHDPLFNEFKLGIVCCYHTMQYCISQRAKTFHFMASRLEYKYRFLGVEQDFDQIFIYRSYAAVLYNIRLASQTMAKWAARDLHLWLMNSERRKDLVSRLAASGVQGWKRIKRFARMPAHVRDSQV